MTNIQPARSPAALPDVAARPTSRPASPPRPAADKAVSAEPAGSDPPPVKEGVSIVVFSGDFDRVQAAFNIALGAASSGQPVTMFFTFWGLDVITRHDASRVGRDPLRTAFRWLKPGGARRLPLTRFNFLGLGPVLMRRLMGQFHMPTVDEMVDMAHDLGVRLVACTVTMGVMGLTEADMLPIVDSYAGVATYLADARVRDVNLFI